jgi:hypothetical protein
MFDVFVELRPVSKALREDELPRSATGRLLRIRAKSSVLWRNSALWRRERPPSALPNLLKAKASRRRLNCRPYRVP